MASQVNTKFVIVLAVGLVCVLGAAALVVAPALKKSGADWEKAGDQAMSAGKFAEASAAYAKAVNKDQANGQFIRKWIQAQEKLTPASRQAYQDEYFKNYLSTLKALADAERTKPEGFKRLLEEQYQLLMSAPVNLAGWESFAKTYEDLVKGYRGDEAGLNTLRRYIGIARAGIIESSPDPAAEVLTGGLEDLKVALQVDPADEESAVALASLELAQAERQRKRGDDAGSKKAEADALAKLQAFAQANPNKTRARLVLLRQEMGRKARNTNPAPTAPELFKAHQAQIQAIVDTLMGQKPEDTDVITAAAIAPWAMIGLPDGTAKATALFEHVKKGHGDDAQFLLAYARFESSRGDANKAISLAKEVAALPDRPLSLKGVRLFGQRAEALLTQANAIFTTMDKMTEQKDRDAAMEQIRSVRKDLAARVGEGAALVQSIDGRLAYVQRDLAGARTLISAYNAQTGATDAQMVLLEGQILGQLGQNGAAREKFETVTKLDRTSAAAWLNLGRLQEQSREYGEAARSYGVASALLPDNAQLKEMTKNMQEAAKGGGSDPVTTCLLEAQSMVLQVGGDTAGAITKLRGCLDKNKGDPRLTAALAQLYMSTGDRAAALAVVDASLAAKPDNPQLKQLKDGLSQDNPLAATLQNVEKSNLTDVQKSLVKYELNMRANKPDEARAALAESIKLAPEDPQVVEQAFADAMTRGDEAAMEKYASVGERVNADKVGGMLFRARVQLQKKQLDQAAASLREVVTKDKLSLVGWRLLGMTELELGKPQQAADALAKAVEIKPDDIPSVVQYLRALYGAGKPADALAFARKSEPFAFINPDFSEMLLNLEATAGDVNRAIASRQQMAEKDPNNRNNRAQLAILLVNTRRYDDAKRVIDGLTREQPDDPVGVQLTASLLGAKGETAQAVTVMREYINRLPKEKRTEQLYINGGRLLLQLGEPGEAVKLLESGREVQDPKLSLIDRELGDVQFNARQFDGAITSYERVLASPGAEQDNAVRLRIMEALLNQKKFAEFDQRLAKMDQKAQNDPTMLLLAAEAAVLQNQRDKASRLYDQVVVADPKNVTAYLKRGDFRAMDPRTMRDAESDYEQMRKIDPTSILSMVRLARMYRQTGRDNQAVELLKSAVATEPQNEQLRLGYVETLRELGRFQDAAVALDDAVTAFKEAPAWRLRAAQGWGQVGNADKAAVHWAAVWKERKAPEIAAGYADTLMNKTPADLASAQAVLGAPEVRDDQTMVLRLLRARLLVKQGRPADAATEISSILGKLDPNSPEQVTVFMSGLGMIYPKAPERMEAMRKLEERNKFTGYLALAAAQQRLTQDSTRDLALSALTELSQTATESRIKAGSFAVLGSVAYQKKEYEKSRELFKKGLDADADNAGLNNNLAYVLAVKLNKADQALVYAQKARELDKNSSGFADTLGAVYLANNKCEDAVRALNDALALALNDGERVPVYIHLGKAKLCLGDKAEARRLALQARDLLNSLPGLKDSFGSDLDELEQNVNK